MNGREINREGFEELEIDPVEAHGKKILLLKLPRDVSRADPYEL